MTSLVLLLPKAHGLLIFEYTSLGLQLFLVIGLIVHSSYINSSGSSGDWALSIRCDIISKIFQIPLFICLFIYV